MSDYKFRPIRQASYEASSFCVNAEKLAFESIGKDCNGEDVMRICKEDFPALMHEWWHYIQDISMVSGQNGFYLWLRDMARIQNYITTYPEDIIHLPLPEDHYGELMNKDRIIFFYNLGGDDDDLTIRETATIDEKPVCSNENFINNGATISYPLWSISIDGKKKRFGLYALQELNAFYLQKIAEGFCPGVCFNKKADDLPVFPYHIGDLLFDHYKIKCDLRLKFIITTLCLDSIYASHTFITFLELYKNQTLSYDKDRDRIINDVLIAQNNNITIRAIDQWVNDYNDWIGNNGWAQPLKDAIKWYIQTLYEFQSVKENNTEDIIASVVSQSIDGMLKLYNSVPAPLIRQDGIIKGCQNNTEQISADTQNSFDSALTIWSCRRIYQMLICRTKEQFNELTKCVLYDKCPYKEKIGREYDCARSPLSIVKNLNKADCPYALAEWIMGLWQKDIVVDID